jgi:hypothetical protein
MQSDAIFKSYRASWDGAFATRNAVDVTLPSPRPISRACCLVDSASHALRLQHPPAYREFRPILSRIERIILAILVIYTFRSAIYSILDYDLATIPPYIFALSKTWNSIVQQSREELGKAM